MEVDHSMFGSHWWRNIGKCGRLTFWAHYNIVTLNYLLIYLLIPW